MSSERRTLGTRARSETSSLPKSRKFDHLAWNFLGKKIQMMQFPIFPDVMKQNEALVLGVS